jgi:UDP-N-acetyl-D-mannosaminuronic acid dehydrogenase
MKTNDTQPAFVLERIYAIMRQKGITDSGRVGLYGITYKENVDDIRESPTLQLLSIQERHLACPLKSYDPFFTDKVVATNQVLDFDQFLDAVDMVVIMVKHNHIMQNWDKLKQKIILDCHNICPIEGVFHI